MKLTEARIIRLHQKYAKNNEHFDRIYTHCKIVRDIAMQCADNTKEEVDIELLEKACLIHDVASSAFMGEGFDYSFYQQHAILGAALLHEEGVDDRVVEIIKNHIQISVTKEDVERAGARLPYKSYEPTTIEGRILNYADRFHSKDPKFVSFESNVKKYEHFMPSQVSKLRQASVEFGIPDLMALSLQYRHPVT